MHNHLVLLDFDGTICANEVLHKKAFEQTLLKFDMSYALPSSWFGMTTENVFKELFPNLPLDQLVGLVDEKRRAYELLEYQAPINRNISMFLEIFTSILEIKIFSNGSSRRIKKFLNQRAITLDVISFADHGLRKENISDFSCSIPEDFDPAKILLIDDDLTMATVARSAGIKFLHYKSSLDLSGEMDDFLNSRCR